MKSVLVISHGSHSPKTREEVSRLVNILKKKSKLKIFEFAFLEIDSPSIPKGIDTCLQKGADEILFLLNFLNSGKHVNEDIPMIVAEAKKKYPQVRFTISKPIGQHERIVNLFLDMIK